MSQRILIVQTAWLGDNILTTPLVANVSSAGEVDVLTIPRWADVYNGNPSVSTVIPFDKNGSDRGLLGLWRTARVLHNRHYDVALIAQRWWRSAMLAKMAKIPVRIGFEISVAKHLYTSSVPYDKSLHESHRLLELARPLVTTLQPVLPQLFPENRHFATAETILKHAGWRENEKIVAIAPTSAWQTKRYPFFDKVAELLARRGFFIVSVGANDDYETCFSSVSTLGNGKYAVLIGEELLTAAAAISIADVLIANDSGAGHIASAVRTPVVSVFGPTVPEQGFAPLGRRNTIVQLDLNCRPCSAHGGKKCPYGHHRCMTEIAPDEIVKAVIKTLEAK
ncbi:MAG TPA: lipopolysaccharide heptosyltransferase II [Planctomycetaceae bacterium]|nr:lipopolysaccharide heptosyltransferase II [Planctomycetaceae bacterium]